MPRNKGKSDDFDRVAFIKNMIDKGQVQVPGVQSPQEPVPPDLDPEQLVRTFQVPDLTEAVEGWRTWQVRLDGPRWEQVKLNSVTFGGYYWKPRVTARAECNRGNPEHVPGENCSCGFYSAKNRKHLLSMGYHGYDVEHGSIAILGVLANWGKVIEGSQGWRAEYAYPVRFYVPFEAWRIGQLIGKVYGVPVELDNFLDYKKKR